MTNNWQGDVIKPRLHNYLQDEWGGTLLHLRHARKSRYEISLRKNEFLHLSEVSDEKLFFFATFMIEEAISWSSLPELTIFSRLYVDYFTLSDFFFCIFPNLPDSIWSVANSQSFAVQHPFLVRSESGGTSEPSPTAEPCPTLPGNLPFFCLRRYPSTDTWFS